MARRIPDRRALPPSLVCGQGGVRAILLACFLAIGGCAWERGLHSKVPVEFARCRELTEQGNLAMQEGQLARAEDRFRQALMANPADVDARRLFAEALWERGETVAAIAQMQAAAQLAPHDSALIVRSGEMLLAANEITLAAEQADLAIADNPRYGPAWSLRGHVRLAQGERPAAMADLHRALVYTPNDRKVLATLSRLYLDHGEARRCLTTIHHLLDLYSPGEEPAKALLIQGQAYLAVGRLPEATDSLYAANRGGETGAELFYALARAEALQGQTEAAVRAAHRALAADSTHSQSIQLLAELSGSRPTGTVVR